MKALTKCLSHDKVEELIIYYNLILILIVDSYLEESFQEFHSSLDRSVSKFVSLNPYFRANFLPHDSPTLHEVFPPSLSLLPKLDWQCLSKMLLSHSYFHNSWYRHQGYYTISIRITPHSNSPYFGIWFNHSSTLFNGINWITSISLKFPELLYWIVNQDSK